MNNDHISPGIVKLRDFYLFKPCAALFQEEFGFFTLDKWRQQGYIKEDENLNRLFGFDDAGDFHLDQLGWCEAAFVPAFEPRVVEDRGDYELALDEAGREVLYFKGRRNGFMPEYVSHPVKDMKTWERDIKWRLGAETPERLEILAGCLARAEAAASEGKIIVNRVIGGYMYLRSLIGPVDLLYKFYDEPELIHACMQAWLDLADNVTARIQESVDIDELFFGEDICYNGGSLISPDMIREFLFPYYTQLYENMKARRRNTARHLFFQIDTDGRATDVIDLYRSIGMDSMSPFEVASGCDVVEIRKKYPDLLMRGGIDKRILASGKEAIDRELDRVIPFMRAAGGYIPTCDHGVPEEVEFEDYMHYRKRMLELGG